MVSIENLKSVKCTFLEKQSSLVAAQLQLQCKIEDEKMFKQQESIKMLKIHSIIENI